MSELVLPETNTPAEWSDRDKAVIQAAGLVTTDKTGTVYVAPPAVIEKFRHTAVRTGLDPLARQLYCIPRWDGKLGTFTWTIQYSIDGFRVIAERSKLYGGQVAPQWLLPDGKTWADVFIPSIHGEHPLAARVGVIRKDWDAPLYAVATWEGYHQATAYGLQGRWKTDGPNMLAKCAEALALRKAFPQDLSGLYTEDEYVEPGPVDVSVVEDPVVAVSSESVRLELPAENTIEPAEESPAEESRDWVGEAFLAPDRETVRKVWTEARDAGVEQGVLDRISAIGAALDEVVES